MIIECDEEIREELGEQFICDEEYYGFNKETILLECLKEAFDIESGIISVE